MSKVICDVCGTTYPDTANQCPICGSAKNSAAQTAAGADDGDYSYVKGGRFSKKNVRKRSEKGPAAVRRSSSSSSTAARTAQSGKSSRNEKEHSNAGLVIVVVLLLIAIAAVLIYIGVLFFQDKPPVDDPVDPSGSSQQTEQQPTDSKPTDPPRVPCTSVQTLPRIELTQVGESWTLTVELTPVDTTDRVLFTTSDPAVAAVDENGTVTAVGPGTADITVTCGDVIATCVVHCNIEEPTEPPTLEPFVMEFNTRFTDSTTGMYEVTMTKKGETWRVYKNGMSADPADVTWISDNPEIASVENGVVTALSKGTVKIHAQYNGTTYTCLVRCSLPAEPEGGEGTEATEPETPYKISHTDVTIKVGESFYLTLKDAEGNKLEVVWEPNDVNVTIEGNKITGAEAGRVIVSTTYEEVTYSCVIYVVN